MKKIKTVAGLIGIIMAALVSGSAALELPDLVLPSPRMEGGMPLLQALKERHSSRAFSTKPLPEQLLSDLLWAACGINRPDSGKRTTPTARNWQEIEVYAVMEDGVYLYDAGAHLLRAVSPKDLREQTGTQPFVATAPLNLVYVADLAKMEGAPAESQALYSATDTGFISQNVYLFCASEGLATVVRGLLDRDTLAKALNLPDHKKIILAQTVGYPSTGE